jgi:hypothetical protein
LGVCTQKKNIICNNVNKISAELLTVKAKEVKAVKMFRYLRSLASTEVGIA